MLERRVQRLAERFQLGLVGFVDDVDLGVVGDGLERDVRHALVDEALTDGAVGRRVGRRRFREFGFLRLAFG